jgi:hypothetical protein
MIVKTKITTLKKEITFLSKNFPDKIRIQNAIQAAQQDMIKMKRHESLEYLKKLEKKLL